MLVLKCCQIQPKKRQNLVQWVISHKTKTDLISDRLISPSIYPKTHFSLPSHLFPPLPFLHSCTFAWLVLVLCVSMPKLKLTYLQITEQAARGIKNRTEARQAQLFRPTFFHKATQTVRRQIARTKTENNKG